MARTELRPIGTDDINETARTVVARRRHVCESHGCEAEIEPGQEFVRAVCFPGHDANGGTSPWAMKLCVACATVAGRPLPPRRREVPDAE